MIAAAVARPTSGKQRPRRRQQEERLLGGRRVGQQQRALAEVVEQQRRQHQREPGDADRPLAEVPHVGIERLAAGDDQEHRAEHGEAVPAVLAEERDARAAGRPPSARSGSRTIQRDAEHRDDHEPDDHDRAEQPADPVRAVPLNREHADQDRRR